MSAVCCAVGCKTRVGTEGLRFYRIPLDLDRRRRWLVALRRGDSWSPTKDSRVCSAHFLSGKSDNPLSPDYVPSLFAHLTPSQKNKCLYNFKKFDIRQLMKRKMTEAQDLAEVNAVVKEMPTSKAPGTRPQQVEEEPQEESKLESFNAYLTERLAAAAVEITSAVEITITGYQEQMSCMKEENERLRRLLEIKPYEQLHEPDSQQLPLLDKQGVPSRPRHCQQEWNLSLEQGDPEPKQVKEEPEEMCGTSLEDGLLSDNKDILTVCVLSDWEGVEPALFSQHQTVERRDEGLLFSNIPGEFPPGPEEGENYIDYIVSEPSSPAAQRERSDKCESHPGSTRSNPQESQTHRRDEPLTIVKETGVYCCRFCDRTFMDMILLVDHQKKMHVPRAQENSCGVCEEVLESKEKLLVHLETHIKVKASTQWQTHTELKSGPYQQTHTELKSGPYQQTHTELKSGLHQQTHTEFKSSPYQQTHTELKSSPYQQTHTELKSSPYQQTLANGIPFPRLQPAVKHSCQVCGMSFPYNHNLKLHMRTHTGEKPFKCKVCGKCYPYKGYMNVHMRLHTGEKPFQCRKCEKSFPTKQYLTNHMMFHTGEKSYRCKDCGKGFYQKEDLDRHLPTHLQEKPFGCLECGKCFKDIHHLTRHKLVHTGERPFTCGVCGRGFGIQSNLKVHQRIHTGEKPYQCKLCGRGFTSDGGRKYHLKALHKLDCAL